MVTRKMPRFCSPAQMKVVWRCISDTQVLRNTCPLGNVEWYHKKENLLDKAKFTYYAVLKEDTNTAKVLGARTREVTDGVSLSEGWALKSPHDSMTLKKSTWRINLTLSSKQVTSKTLREWQRICVLQKKQMGRGCSQARTSSPHNRYSRSFQEWHLTSVKLRGYVIQISEPRNTSKSSVLPARLYLMKYSCSIPSLITTSTFATCIRKEA